MPNFGQLKMGVKGGTLPGDMSLYIELSDSCIQRGARNSKLGGRAISTSDCSVAVRQSLLDDFLFVPLEGIGEGVRLRTVHGLAREPRPVDRERVTIAE